MKLEAYAMQRSNAHGYAPSTYAYALLISAFPGTIAALWVGLFTVPPRRAGPHVVGYSVLHMFVIFYIARLQGPEDDSTKGMTFASLARKEPRICRGSRAGPTFHEHLLVGGVAFERTRRIGSAARVLTKGATDGGSGMTIGARLGGQLRGSSIERR